MIRETENGKRKTENFLTRKRECTLAESFNFIKTFAFLPLCAFALIVFAFNFASKAQEMPPKPSAPKTVSIPAVKSSTLKNGLQVAVIERKNVPLVTVQLLVKSGAEFEDAAEAGLADMTASLLTKGTPTRTAEQIAQQIEFLGGSINTGAGWNSSVVVVNVMSDKLDQALAIMSDSVLNPSFKQSEIDLLKSQTLDGLAYNLKQPGFLANYVASKYSFNEHPASGTPDSINAIKREDIVRFHKENYDPNNVVLIFTGDVIAKQANLLAQKYFGKWKNQVKSKETSADLGMTIVEPKESVDKRKQEQMNQPLVKRILVVDLPNSGQAAVAFAKDVENDGRTVWNEKKDEAEISSGYYPALVLNSVLGGGYSSRLNQEIRIKRGLSYGAGSNFDWRAYNTNFATRTQTKNESAAEVAQLVIEEVKKLQNGTISGAELGPRKLVLNGNFGRGLETTGGLAGAVAELYTFGLPTTSLNAYMTSVASVSDAQIQKFAGENLSGGDIIIVGDYAVFKDDLAKRFPDMRIMVVKATDLDLSSDDLMKAK